MTVRPWNEKGSKGFGVDGAGGLVYCQLLGRILAIQNITMRRGSEVFDVCGVGEGVEGAVGALGGWFAEFFSGADEQGVEFVEEGGVFGEVGLEDVLELVVVGVGVGEMVSDGDAGGVGVDDEDRAAPRGMPPHAACRCRGARVASRRCALTFGQALSSSAGMRLYLRSAQLRRVK